MRSLGPLEAPVAGRLGMRPMTDAPHFADIHVGARIRQFRLEAGLTQQALADRLGIRPQQIQKYETYENRVSASRLWEISQILSRPIAAFFSGIPNTEPDLAQLPITRETCDLVRYFRRLPENQRQSFLGMVRTLSGGREGDPPSS